MPLYEYKCEECGHQFEARRAIKERNDVECPDCKGAVLIKISLQGKPLAAHPFTVIGHDGTILSQRQITERTPISGRVPGTDRVINV